MTHAEPSPDSDDRPLQGLRVVVTRPPGQAGPFAARLRALGAEPVPCPTIRIVPPADPEPLRRAAAGIGDYAWVVFTSVNGVDHLGRALEDAGRDGGAISDARVAAIGPATADRVRDRFGVDLDVVPEEFRAEALAAAIRSSARREGGPEGRELQGERVLLPRAEEARPVLPERLAEAGADVDQVTAYRAEPPEETETAAVRRQLGRGEIDWITFTASSTVRNFASAVGTEVGRARVAAIGPVTAGTAREHGLPADVVADEYTIPGLLDSLVRSAGGDDREAA